MREAVIDIGSNSVRLMITDRGNCKKYLTTTMLAEGLAARGILSSEAMSRTCAAVLAFVKQAKIAKVKSIAMFATAAVRAAANGKQFAAYLQELTGLSLDILSGETEAEIGFLGAAEDVRGSCAVLDIGGASTELVAGNYPNIFYKSSLPMGVILLKEQYDWQAGTLQKAIGDALKNWTPPPFERLIGIGGTLTTLAAMDLGLKTYDPKRIHNHLLQFQNLEGIKKQIFLKNIDITALYPTVSAQRAMVIRQGIVLVMKTMEHLARTEITISEKDNLEGYSAYKNI